MASACNTHVASNVRGKAQRKKLPRFMPCNPLKSLDSDERIQGNPRESNALNLGFQSETAKGQDNPNGTIGANIAAATQRPRPLGWCKEGQVE
jgi:hypothetical protein